jgi:hypothetical protein
MERDKVLDMAPKTNAITVLSPQEAAVEANKFIPRETFQQLSFWGKLNRREQDTIFAEGNQLNAAMIMNASSNLAIGQHLKKLHTLLAPYPKAWNKFVRQFNFTIRTAYRHMNDYEAVLERFHFQDHLLHAAMARGMNLPGKYAEAITALPPPRNLTEEGSNRYLDQIIKTRNDITKARKDGTISEPAIVVEAKKDPQTLQVQCFRIVKNALRHLNTRQRRRFLESHVGMLLTEQGSVNSMMFSPEAIPEDFRQGRGRPRANGEANV